MARTIASAAFLTVRPVEPGDEVPERHRGGAQRMLTGTNQREVLNDPTSIKPTEETPQVLWSAL